MRTRSQTRLLPGHRSSLCTDYTNNELFDMYVDLKNKVIHRLEESIQIAENYAARTAHNPAMRQKFRDIVDYCQLIIHDINLNAENNSYTTDFGFLWRTIDEIKQRFRDDFRARFWDVPVDEYRDINLDDLEWIPDDTLEHD